MDDAELAAVVRRLAAVSGDRWELATADNGEPVVRVMFDGGAAWDMRVTRDGRPASADDVRFIARARSDLERLVVHLNGADALSDDELHAIEERSRRASKPPWTAFLERDGGMGGDDMIRISDLDEEPDLYLWVGQELAPSDDFEFVGSARQDISTLIAAINLGEHS